MTRLTAFLLGLTLLLAGGVVHGLSGDRWQSSTALPDACAKVPDVPKEVDGWIGEDQPTDEKEYAQAGAQGYWSRIYRKDGKGFLVILMAGHAKRMSLHTPEVCYRGAGFELHGQPTLYTARGTSADELGVFWTANFVKGGVIDTNLQMTWGWSDGASLWSAPANPRWTFRGLPALYKLYLSQEVTGVGSDVAAKSRNEFLRAFLPELNRTLGIDPKEKS